MRGLPTLSSPVLSTSNIPSMAVTLGTPVTPVTRQARVSIARDRSYIAPMLLGFGLTLGSAAVL
jgi:hypothetical protein